MTSELLPVFQPAPMIFEHGEGAWLTTTDGERYLDFGAGIAVKPWVTPIRIWSRRWNGKAASSGTCPTSIAFPKVSDWPNG